MEFLDRQESDVPEILTMRCTDEGCKEEFTTTDNPEDAVCPKCGNPDCEMVIEGESEEPQ